jgi:hypothetical protein
MDGATLCRCLVVALLILTPASGQTPEKGERKSDSPDREVVRLSPTAFPELPQDLARELVRRGCTIPQPSPQRRNVIRGHFAKAGSDDWAVLCYRRKTKTTTLLVFWNGSAENPTQLIRGPYSGPYDDFVPSGDYGVMFEWFIRPVGRKFILGHYQGYGGPKPPPIDHEGIESGGDSASIVLYYYRGRWLKLQGAD